MNLSCYKKKIEGSLIYIKSNPVVGITAITSFTEDLVGVTVTDFFVTKEFRYTKDGINFSDWVDLNLTNLTILSFLSTDSVIFELLYKKSVPSLTLDVNEVILVTLDSPTNYVETYFQKSIFSEFFTSSDLEVLNWYISVLQKVYRLGLLPNYIQRVDEETDSDEDFITFWKSVAKFFSFIVIYSRYYGKFYSSVDLLHEFLSQRNLTYSQLNTLVELQYLMKTYYHQVFNRGTIHIKDDSSINTSLEIDGEMLRLINYRPTDEFIFNYHKLEHFGWNLGNSSPLWRGMYQNQNSYKSLFSGEEVKVDSNLSYGISFFLQTSDPITVTVESRDLDGNIVDLYSYKDGGVSNSFLSNISLQRGDRPIFLQFFLYSFNKTPYINGTTNLNQGNHLILNQDSSTIKITIQVGGSIVVLNQQDNKYTLYPLFTNYSHGIVQVPNWVSVWLKNNNNTLSEVQLLQFIRKYLIPYNSHLEIVKTIDSGVEIDEVEPNNNLAWRGIDPVCQYTQEIIEVYYVGIDPYCEQDDVELPYE